MENTQIQQVQLSTLNTIRRFVTEWNQDPVSQTSSLMIIGNQVFITSRDNNIVPLQLPIEEPPILFEDNDMPLQLSTKESLVPFGDIPLPKDFETFTPVTENPEQIDNSIDPKKNRVDQIRNDLLVRSNNTPFQRCNKKNYQH
ncbi:11628_t:CDS:2 [Gigaspora margarita]|uniref:11628_t:CDS:1 n=1 Tax=Gigaspora margarita TaxID=4874 RepID=A0ABM8VWX4_GIGMA|nr:11628_t:CDS:2 [Gigaspora margarita]